MSGGALSVRSPAPGAPGRPGRTRTRYPRVREVARYALVGGLATGLNAAIYLVVRHWWEPVPANLVALVLSTVVSTEAHRRFTFRDAGAHRWRAHLQIGATVLFYACYSSTVLLLLHYLTAETTPVLESAVVAAASVAGGVVRFLLLRHWVFGTEPGTVAVR